MHDFLGLPISTELEIDSIVKMTEEAIGSGFFVTFMNPHSYYIASKDKNYSNYLHQFDAILPDGIMLAKAVPHVLNMKQDRISFDSTSLAIPIFNLCVKRGFKVALVGGKEGVAEEAANTIRKTFPQINIVKTLHGYQENETLCLSLLEASPDVVISGMGAPRQEEFLLEMKGRGFKGAGFTCGGYLDQLVQGLNYYPAWINKTNTRWLYRIFKEPGRLLRRYIFEYQVFFVSLVKFSFKKIGF